MMQHGERAPISPTAYAALERRVDEQTRTITSLREAKDDLDRRRIAAEQIYEDLQRANGELARQVAELRANISTLVDERTTLEEKARRHEGWLRILDSHFENEADSRADAYFQSWRASGYDGDPLSKGDGLNIVRRNPAPVADGATAQRFDEPHPFHPSYEHLQICAACQSTHFEVMTKHLGEPPVTEAEHLHAAQLAARAHVSPHIRAAAAALANAGGSPEDCAVYLALAEAIDGHYDGVIIRVLRAIIRFTEGGAKP